MRALTKSLCFFAILGTTTIVRVASQAILSILKGELPQQVDDLNTSPEGATLLVLQSLVSGEKLIDSVHVIILPDIHPLSKEAGAKILAHLAKPVICRSSLILGTLAVTCYASALTPGLDSISARTARLFYQKALRESGNSPSSTVQVRAGQNELFLSISEFGNWLAEYNFMYCFVRTSPPDVHAKLHGAVLTFRVIPGTLTVDGDMRNTVH